MNTKELSYHEWVRMYKSELEDEYRKSDPDETLVKCSECYGRGYDTCDLGHEHDCEECDGEGKVQADTFENYTADLYDTQLATDKQNLARYQACLSQS